MRVTRRSGIALATAGALASTGSVYLGARNLLMGQAMHVRTVIPRSWDAPPRADGVYIRGGGPVERWQRGMSVDLHLMIFGDSTATGYGCTSPEEVPGVLIARKLAEQTGLRIRLSTKAIVGATSKGVSGQVDAMFVVGPPPDAAVMMLGANDITALNGVGPSAQRLSRSVRKLRACGAVVVVGTCPDLGVVAAIPQPLRSVVRTRGMQLARAQAGAVRAAGGVPVPLASLLAPQFRSIPDQMFSSDGYHPSATGYALAAEQLFVALCEALGEKIHVPMPVLPSTTPTMQAEQNRRTLVSRLWRRTSVAGAPADDDGSATDAIPAGG